MKRDQSKTVFLLDGRGNFMVTESIRQDPPRWERVSTKGVVGVIEYFELNEYSPGTHATVYTRLFVYQTTELDAPKPNWQRLSPIEGARYRYERIWNRRYGAGVSTTFWF